MDANHHHHREMEFYCAATAGNLEVVDRFLAQDDDDDDPSTIHRHSSIVTTQAYAGHSILHGACAIHRPGVVQALLERPQVSQNLLNLPDQRRGRTPLQTCIAAKHDDLAALLLQHEDLNVKHLDQDRRNALHLACYYNSAPSVIHKLIQKMKNRNNKDNSSPSSSFLRHVHKPDVFDKTPLLYAADHGNVGIVQTLLAYSNASTIAATCCWEWELSHVRGLLQVPHYQAVACLLMDAGIEILTRVTATQHPYKIHIELMQWLHHHQHNNVAQHLRTAAARGDVPKLQAFLSLASSESSCRHEATTNAGHFIHQSSPAPSRYTALHCAARYGSAAAVSFLLEAGASPWTQGDSSSTIPTALQLAVTYGHLSVVEELLRHTLVTTQRR